MNFSALYTHRCETPWEQRTAPFDELIVSWGAERPKQGAYRFYVSVRCDAVWSERLLYAEWGASGQRTFASKGTLASSYQDTISTASHLADAFRVEVESLGGASLPNIRAFYACASRLQLFRQCPIPDLPTVLLPLWKLHSQMRLDHPRSRDLCSPTSLSMALGWLHCRAQPAKLAERVKDLEFDIYGNWILNTAEGSARLGRKFCCRVERLADFAALHRRLLTGMPVIVSVKGPLPGAPYPYLGGHLIVVIGWDSNRRQVICADPARDSDKQVLTSYAAADFLEAWGRRFNLAYVFERK